MSKNTRSRKTVPAIPEKSLKSLHDAMFASEGERLTATERGEPEAVLAAIVARPAETDYPGISRLAAIYEELAGGEFSLAGGRNPFTDWILPRLRRLDFDPDMMTISEAAVAIETNRDLPALICPICKRAMADSDRDRSCTACRTESAQAYRLTMGPLVSITTMGQLDGDEAYREIVLRQHVDREIQYHARKLFGHERFTRRTWDELIDWLKFEHGLSDQEIRELARSRLIEMLKARLPSAERVHCHQADRLTTGNEATQQLAPIHSGRQETVRGISMSDTPRVPTVEQVRDLYETLWAFFWDRGEHSWGRKQEQDFLPLFINLAEALRPLRSLVNSIENWPLQLEDGIEKAIESFDQIVRDWKWEEIAEADPDRSRHLEDRRARFREAFERPFYEAVLSWRAGRKEIGFDSSFYEYVEEGRKLGFGPTLTPTEGRTRARLTVKCLHEWLVLGDVKPRIDEERKQGLTDAFRDLESALNSAGLGRGWSPRHIHSNIESQTKETTKDGSIEREMEAPHFSESTPIVQSPTATMGIEQPKKPPVILGEVEDEPEVWGRRKKRLTPPQYRLVKALLDSHPDRLALDTLARKSEVDDPAKMIDRLRRDPDWADVLDKAGQSYGGYGIRMKRPMKRSSESPIKESSKKPSKKRRNS